MIITVYDVYSPLSIQGAEKCRIMQKKSRPTPCNRLFFPTFYSILIGVGRNSPDMKVFGKHFNKTTEVFNMKKALTAKVICRMGITAGLYATLTVLLAPISYGQFQVRVSECLTLLPLVFPETVIGLTVGCLIANFFGNGILDVIFGTLATLVSSLLILLIGKFIKNKGLKIFLSALCVSVINAVVIPFTYLALTELKTLYFINAGWIFLGEAVSSGILGTLVVLSVMKITAKEKE